MILSTLAGFSFAILIVASLILLFLKDHKRVYSYIGHCLSITAITLSFMHIFIEWKTLHYFPIYSLSQIFIGYLFIFLTIGYLLYIAWKDISLYSFCAIVALILLVFNYSMPEADSNYISPELMNRWYFPYLLGNMAAFSLFTISFSLIFRSLYLLLMKNTILSLQPRSMNLFYIGFIVLSTAILFGVLWNLEAFGRYWIWEFSEIWTFIAWIICVLFIYITHHNDKKPVSSHWILGIIQLMLISGWLLINYLPSFNFLSRFTSK